MAKKTLPIVMLTSICGPDFDLQPKQETDRFSVAEAVRLIESGQAVPVSQAAFENATRKAPESRGAGASARKGAADVVASVKRAVKRATGAK